MGKVLLSTYSITIEQDDVCQILNEVNPDYTFIELFNLYCDEILQEVHVIKKSSQYKQALTMPNVSDPRFKRHTNNLGTIIYGYFRAGVSDNKYDIENDQSRIVEFSVNPNLHTSYKNVFFYLSVPKDSTEGFLILQRIENFGIKTRLTKSFHKFLNKKIEDRFKFKVSNKIPTEVLERMMKDGNLKEIEFIEEEIPSTWEEYHTGIKKAPKKKGKIKTIISAEGGFTQGGWKRTIVNLFSGTDSSATTVRIPDLEREYDEVSFKMEFNHKKTKFHIINRHKIQPTVDVTHLVDYDQQDEPTVESLKKESQELIDSLLILNPE